MLEARDLTIQRGRNVLLRGTSLALHPGELLVIAGMNGAGKTTLLRALSGELSQTKGSITIHGKPLTAYRSHELAQIRAYLEQRTSVALPFRALEVARLGAEVAGGDSDALAEQCLEVCGVGHLAERLIDTLSGGEQQRVHWARVLAQLGGPELPSMEGKCLLLDEPVSALDLAHQHEMMALVRRLVQKGCAAVAVLHDLNLSAEYGDRLLMLGEGTLLADGAPATVLTPELIRRCFGVNVQIAANPATGSPWVFVTHDLGAPSPALLETARGSEQ